MLLAWPGAVDVVMAQSGAVLTNRMINWRAVQQDFTAWVKQVEQHHDLKTQLYDHAKVTPGILTAGNTVVVSRGGSVQDAVNAAPDDGTRIIIKISAGTYKEMIVVPEGKLLTFQGLGNPVLAYGDTEDSAGSMQNSASTVILADDFIATGVVFQDCELHSEARDGNGSLTTQLRSSGDETTGFAFVGCAVTGSGPIYLGRTWGPSSRVVFVRCRFDDIILPQGWSDWGVTTRAKTVFYGEYQCSGPGTEESERVGWSHELTADQAAAFTSLSFIDGDQWLQS